MSAVFPTTPISNQVANVVVPGDKVCPPALIVPYLYESQVGWNAVLVGFLSSLLAIVFLLTSLYYFLYRYRLNREYSDSPVALTEKNGGSSIPVATSSQTATTTFINDGTKETKISTYTEQTTGDVALLSNGHSGSPSTSNGHADPSELRLLAHEHN